jgi:hypothetical protein
MSATSGLRICCLVWLAAACGDDVAKPITRIDVHNLRDSLARAQGPQDEVLHAMREPDVSRRIIYDPPVDLTLKRSDSLVTAPLGITAAPDSATAPATR